MAALVPNSGWGAISNRSFGLQSYNDLTAVFEHAALTILPTAVLITACPFYILHYQTKPTVSRRSKLFWGKLIVAGILSMLEVTKTIILASIPELRKDTVSAGSSLSCIAALCISVMLGFEHRRATHSSMSLTLYLSVGACIDAIRTWSILRRPDVGRIGMIGCAIVVVKVVLVILQELPKPLSRPASSQKRQQECGQEATGGFWNRTLLVWLNSTLLFGFHQSLTLSNLSNLGLEFSANHLLARFEPVWKKSTKKSPRSLMRVSLRVLFVPLLVAGIPRAISTIVTFILPLIIKRVLFFLRDSDPPEYVKYELVFITGLSFISLMLSRTLHLYFVNRLSAFFRGLLIALIFNKTLKLTHSAAKKASALTLMTVDVDGIIDSMRQFHDIWLSVVEIGLSLYFLAFLIGKAFVLSMFPLFIWALLSWYLSRQMVSASTQWNESTEARVSNMSTILSEIKGIKMIGIESDMMDYMQALRYREVESAKKVRKLKVVLISMLPLQYWILPLTLIGGGLFWTVFQDILDPILMFLTLAYVNLMAEPMTTFVTYWPEMGTMYACFKRIQDYLLLEEREDYRQSRNFQDKLDSKDNPTTAARQLEPHNFVQDLSTRSSPISFLDVSVASHQPSKAVLNDIQISITASALVAVAGPVGSGKTVFLKTILGETTLLKGTIHTDAGYIAFCDQRPWLPDVSIRNCIISDYPFDEKWYNAVVTSCLLDYDISRFAEGDKKMTGNNGASLSGGQKQRIALARAVYSRIPLVVLDDVFSALDADTAKRIFLNLFGENGILKRHKRTTILATHFLEFLHAADQILIVDRAGNIRVKSDHVKSMETLQAMQAAVTASTESDTSDNCAFEVEQLVQEFELEKVQPSATISDFDLYRVLFTGVSWKALLAFFMSIACVAVLERMPDIYMRIWVSIDPTEKSYFIGMTCLAFSAFFVNAFAAWIFMLGIIPYVSLTLHKTYLDAVMNATLPFLTATNNGILLNRFSQDLTLLSHELPIAFYRVAYALFLAATDTIMISSGTRFAIITIPGIVIAFYFLQLFYLRTSRQMRVLDLETKTPLYSKMNDIINGIEHIRAFGWQKTMLDESLTLLDESQKPFYYLYSLQRWLLLVLDSLCTVLALITVIMAVFWRDSTTEESLGLALIILMAYSLALRNLVRNWTTLETSLGAVSRLQQFVKSTPTEKDSAKATAPTLPWPSHGNIEFKNVGARYSSVGRPSMAIEDVSVTIGQCEKAVIIGRTGSGKSSLLLTLLNCLKHTGLITIDGVDIRNIPRAQLRSMITIIPQEPVDIPGSVRNNLIPTDIMKDHSQRKIEDKKIQTVLQSVQLWSHIVMKGGINEPMEAMEFSSGQRQLLSLARAMLHKLEMGTKIVLMDEPLSHVDDELQEHMQQVMSVAFRTCTKLVISHSNLALRECDILMEFREGRLVFKDHLRESVVDDPLTRRLWEARDAAEAALAGPAT